MKRVKIMLTAMTVLAIVGGALAFRAQNVYRDGNVYLPGENPAFCDVPETLLTHAQIGRTSFATFGSPAPCADITVTDID